MTSQTFNPIDQLKRIIAEGGISEEALEAITGIPGDVLASFFEGAPSGEPRLSPGLVALSDDESARLSTLAAQLIEGCKVDEDERLKAIFESLTIECRLTVSNIAQLTGLDVDDLGQVLRDRRTVPIEKKYELAVRGSYLINAVNRAHRL